METQEILPEYVLQPHTISRAAYRLSGTARKLIAMGMAILPPDLSSLLVTFSVLHYCKSLGLDMPGGETYTLIKEAVRECLHAEIFIETDTGWKMFTWISYAEYNSENNSVSLEFSRGLAEYLLELKRIYARIDLADMGKMRSSYAIHLFELAKSYESLAGQRGNARNCWYFERTIQESRVILGIEAGDYTKTNDFRKRVIDGPLKELNESNLGIKITPAYVRKGKFLISIRFNCEKVARKVQSRKKKSVTEQPMPEKYPQFAQELEVKEGEHLKKLYAEEYAQLYADLIKTPENAMYRDMPHLWAKRVDSLVCEKIKARHGIRK